MDSVNSKNAFLSMTGIDKTEENSEAIVNLDNAVSSVNATIANFVKNDVPFFVKMNGLNQVVNINGFVPIKRDINGWGKYISWDPIVFNPPNRNKDGNIELAGDVGKRYQMTFDVNNGLDVNGPVTLKDNALKMSYVDGLTQKFTDLQTYLSKIPSTMDFSKIQAKLTEIDTIIADLQLSLSKNSSTQDVIKIQAKITEIDDALLFISNQYIIDSTQGFPKVKVGVITGPEIVNGAIKSAHLDKNISIYNLQAGDLMASNVTAVSGFYEGANKNPFLNISIPFLPLLNDNVAIRDISFFVPNISASANPMLRFRYPFSYYIHGISILYDNDNVSNTATINLYLYDQTGKGTKKLLATANIPTNLGKFCDYFKFPLPLLVAGIYTLGGDHKFSVSSDKEVTYVIYGFQASSNIY